MTVICNQTGKKIFVKASDLHVSKVISTKDLKTGAQLILQEDGVPLQVTLINENKIVGQKSKNTQRNAEKVTPLVKNEVWSLAKSVCIMYVLSVMYVIGFMGVIFELWILLAIAKIPTIQSFRMQFKLNGRHFDNRFLCLVTL